MIFFLFFVIGCIWGVGYILFSIIDDFSNRKGKGVNASIGGMIVLDIVILIFSAFFGGAGIIIGLLICFLVDTQIGASSAKISTEKGMKELKKEIEAQDKYDNDWGIISWEEKDKNK